MSDKLKLLSKNKIFGGWQEVYSHQSTELKCEMKFGIFLPSQTNLKKVPLLYWLSGLTCTEQNFITKSGAQRYAEEEGIAIVSPDTSPRNCNINGEDDSYDFGSGAGFYVDATVNIWKENYRMYSYITKELPEILKTNFPVDTNQQSIFGHSMGGHGALTIFLKNIDRYKSVSAFSPICNPIQCPWGIKAFTGYLGENKNEWNNYDASILANNFNESEKIKIPILIDQGKDDNFLHESQLLPENFKAICDKNNIPVNLRMQEGYDHSYYFISTFIGDHIKHHSSILNKVGN